MNLRCVQIFIFFCLVGGTLSAQLPENLHFQQIGKAEGLSQGEVEAICRDHLGLLWIGTRNGLNVWNGYEMKTYFHDPEDSLSLSANGVWDISEDPWGDLWIASNAGLDRFNRSSQTFDLFLPNDANPDSLPLAAVMSVHWSADTVLWIGGYGGAYNLRDYHPSLSTDEIAFRCIAGKRAINSPRQPSPLSILEDSRGNIWFNTTSGIIWVNGQTDEYTFLWPLVEEEPLALHNLSCNTQERIPGEYWVSLNGAGLLKVTLEECPGDTCSGPGGWKMMTERFTENPDNAGAISTNMVTYSVVDTDHRLWAGSARGVNVLSQKDATFDHLMPVTGDPASLRHQSIYSAYRDHEGILYFGTREGISYHSPHRKSFRTFRQIPNSDKGLTSNHVETLFEASDGTIWVSSQKNLSRLNPESQEFFHYPTRQAESEGTNAIVKHIHEEPDGTIWISSQKSLIKFDPKTDLFTHYKLNPNDFRSIGTRNLFDILPDGKGGLYVGSYEGILHFDPSTEEFRIFQGGTNWFCLDLHVDRQGTFWAAGGRELFQFDPGTESFTVFKGWGADTMALNLALTYEFHEDSQGRLWLGTDNGLIQISQETEEVIQWSTFTDLPGGTFRSIEEDRQGRLWLGTETGIYCLDPSDSTVTHYDQADGLHGNSIYNRCSFTLGNGQMMFGGEGGFTIFDPAQIQSNSLTPTVVFTDFLLFNKPVPISRTGEEEGFHLSGHISTQPEIVLRHDENIWEVRFASTDLTAPEENRYRYRLLGFEEDWVEAGSRRSATYTNLNEGDYLFEVVGSNNDGVWSSQPAILSITITPPWYRSWWAYSMYLLLTVMLIYLGVRSRTAAVRREERTKARIEKAKLEERETTRARSSQDFHDEAGNRLTKIAMYTGLLQQEFPSQTKAAEFLKQIEDHTQGLTGSMRDFIWVLDPKQDLLSDSLLRIRQFGDNLFQHTGITFIWKNELPASEGGKRLSTGIKRHFLLIFKEAMHNVLKHSGATEVLFECRAENNTWTFTLTDNGNGFDRESLTRKNGLLNMDRRAHEMQATLLTKTAPGMGTSIRLTIENHPNG